MSLKIRPAQDTDYPQAKTLLMALDLYYADLKFKDFWVAEDQGKIVGTAQLEEFPDFLFLGSVGVAADQQKQGLAKVMLDTILKKHKKDVYLYTIIPEFFKKFGFEPITPNSLPADRHGELTTPNSLPTKERYECEYCQPEKCVTMVQHAA